MKKSVLYFLTLFLFITSIATAATISQTYYFETPITQQDENYDYIKIDNCPIMGNPGEPYLPVRGVKLLLPPGEEVTQINLVLGEKIKLDGTFNLKPAQQQYPLSYDGETTFTELQKDILTSYVPFPQEKHGYATTQFYAGHGIAFMPIYPVEYLASTGEAWYYTSITVELATQSTSRSANSHQNLLKVNSTVNKKLEKMIDNPQEIATYGTLRNTRDEGDYDYLIITNQALADNFQPLADYKNECGILTQIHTVESIYALYMGQDNAEKIRNFIIDEYTNHDITYLLLGGDADSNDGIQVIPHRGMFDDQGWYTDHDIPADIYYSCLDGTWNDDGDNDWGEPNEDDLIAEVFVGRAPVDNATEADNFVNKALLYQQSPVIEDIEKAYMVGEDLGWTAWGSDYKEEIRLGSNSWGYETVGFPDNFEVETLYDTPSFSWSAMNDLLPIFNDGVNLLNHLGHCLNDNAMKFDTYQVTDNNFTNDGVTASLHINYSQGCYCGAFDNRGTGSSYVDDSITEVWTTIEHGAVAFISNSRYGWGDNDGTNGSSQYYDREFFDAIFAEDIYTIGETQQDSKEDCIWAIGYNENRWCYYCSNLFGDPTLKIWTETPREFSVEHIGVYPIGMPTWSIVVNDDNGLAVENAKVALSYEGELVGTAMTDGNGEATIELFDPVLVPGELKLMVTAHNILDHEEDILIVAGMAIEGNVTSNQTTDALCAYVYNDQTGFYTTSNENDGFYRIYVTDPGDYVIKAQYWGFDNFTSETITVTEDDTIPYDIAMTPLANAGSIEGYIYSASGIPVENVQVSLVGINIPSTYTDITGHYSFDPLVPDYDYEIYVHHPNYEGQTQGVHVNENENHTIDFTMAYIEIFEDTEGGFYHEGGFFNEWEWGQPTPQGGPEEGAYSGINCWGTDLDDEYGTNRNMYMYTAPYSLHLSTTPSLIFYTWYEAEEGWDGGNIQVSNDDGETWTLLVPSGGYPDNSVIALSGIAGYTGFSEEWLRQEFDLTDYVDQTVSFRFRFASTNSCLRGWFIDNFAVNGGTLATAAPSVFQAQIDENDVALSWEAPATQDDVDGYNLYRKLDENSDFGDPYAFIDFGTNDYEDTDLPAGHYYYGLTTLYSNGLESMKVLTDVEIGSGITEPALVNVPRYYSLSQNYPNPFNPSTEINYAVPEKAHVSLKIYNLQGNLVKTLVEGEQEASYYNLKWNGNNDAGQPVNSGVYIYRLTAGSYQSTKRMILLK